MQDTRRALSTRSGARGYSSGHSAWEANRRAEELIAAIVPLVTDPVPALPGRRTASLSDPQGIGFKKLADAPTRFCIACLNRHMGNDTLVEEALLSFAPLPTRSASRLSTTYWPATPPRSRHCSISRCAPAQAPGRRTRPT